MTTKLPHDYVYACLKVSKTHGIGVFAIRDIAKGTDIFPDLDDDIIWIEKNKVATLPDDIRRLYEYYCVDKVGRYGCPRSFNLLNSSWFINHSSKPNVEIDKSYKVIAASDIKRGEELTSDYRLYMDGGIPDEWSE